jgi:hypothetical protein
MSAALGIAQTSLALLSLARQFVQFVKFVVLKIHTRRFFPLPKNPKRSQKGEKVLVMLARKRNFAVWEDCISFRHPSET